MVQKNRIITVHPSSATTDFNSIQEAIADAVDGDVVLVDDGTYYENLVLSGKTITVKSVNGPDYTIIDGQSAGRVVQFLGSGDNFSIFQGLTVQKGYIAGDGAGIFINQGASPTIVSCRLINNGAGTGSGGGIYSLGSGVVIRNSIFEDNLASSDGGAIYLEGSDNLIDSSSFSTNETLGGSGGAIYARSPELVINNSTFNGNNSGIEGGAVYLGNTAINNKILNSFFSYNTSVRRGGGAYIWGQNVQVVNTVFTQNLTTSATYGYGGGVYTQAAASFVNCSFYNNNSAINGSESLYLSGGEVVNSIFWQDIGTAVYNNGGTISYTASSDLAYAGDGNIDISSEQPFVDPATDDFRLQKNSSLKDAGTTIDWLFSDQRGSLRPINSTGEPNALFDIGAMEHSAYYGGIEGDLPAKAFTDLAINSTSVAIGYGYSIEWKDRSPFPYGDQRIQQAGEYTVNLALVNSSGLRVDLGTFTRKVSQFGYTVPYTFNVDHIGQWRLRLEMASDPNQYVLSEPITIQYKELNAYYYGTRIQAPKGALADQKPDFEDDTVVFWSDKTKRLYAIGGPKTIVITWYGDEERTIPIPMVAYITYPPASRIHVADSMPVPLLVDDSPFDAVEIKFSDNDALISAGRFTASTEGWAVLLFQDNEGATADAMEVFEVVRTRQWNDNDSAYTGDVSYPVEQAADIGSAVTDPGHDSACANGYVFFEETWIDAYGENRSYDRVSRDGDIFPVNQDFTGPIVDGNSPKDDLVVIWYDQSTATGVCWPYLSSRYTPQWPALPPEDKIYIDSGQGTGPLDPTIYGLLEDMLIYNQPDRSRPGFNPNEEHAAFFTAQGSINPGVFPLRSDLNTYQLPDTTWTGPLAAQETPTSEPYVLLKFINPNTGKWDMKAFEVLDTDGVTPFTYPGIAGNEINAPYPLNQFVYGPCSRSYTSTPELVLNDKDDKMYSYRGDVNAKVSYFYKLQPGFYFDLDGDSLQDEPVNTCIAWLDGRDGSFDSMPVESTYAISWPSPVPTLFVGETLIDAKTQAGETVGLPEIGSQCVVDILFDELGNGGLVKLIDPLKEYGEPYPLGNPETELPIELLPEKDLGSGRWVFTGLPPHIQNRLTYDDVAEELKLKGTYTSGIGEPLLLLNVLSDRELLLIKGLTIDAPFEAALDTLNEKGKAVDGSIQGYPSLKEAEKKALTAGDAAGTGYVTLAFNNDPFCPAPTMLSVIQVGCGLYRGDIKVIESDNPFEEKVTMRHNGDFGGNADIRAFQWRYLRADFPGDPDLPTGPDDTSWLAYEPVPTATQSSPDGTFYDGAVDTVIQGTGEQLLPDKWFSVRYYMDGVCGAAGDPADPGNYSAWSEPQLYEGWLKRVMKKINLFDQKVKDYHSTEVNDLISMIELAGPAYAGDVALSNDPEHLQNLGIIEVYETLLKRGLSLVSTDSQDLNQALLLISNKLADLYMLLGNEAYADAADPTIAFTTESGEYGIQASSIFSFQNQVDSLLEEELALLRGRDRSGVRPFYNRLVWNFTIGDGEVAYQTNYNITDQVTVDTDGNVYPDGRDGEINEDDARVQYPQGHGDAWGYYLMGMKKYYELLKHDLFTWIPAAESILVAGVPVKVDYRDERKFAAAGAAKAKAGAEIVNLTYRNAYTEDPEGQWQGYKDSDPSRAWGVDGWSRRAGQGAFFDWVVGNAILPAEYGVEEQVAAEGQTVFNFSTISYTPGQGELEVKVNGQLVGAAAYDETAAGSVTFYSGLSANDRVRFRVISAYGIEKVDRGTVVELWNIAGNFDAIQAEVDMADTGLNPLGLAKDVVPFDIDPQQVSEGQSHFEQIYGRAVQAMNNAISVFNHANQSSRLLRNQQDSFEDFQRNIENMEADYNNRLIEVFGYPYPDDCGPGKTYTTSECGTSPDLYHYMYVDASELMGTEAPKTHEFNVAFKDLTVTSSGAVEEADKLVTFHVSTDSRFGIIKPAEWVAERKAPGEIQIARSELLQTRGRLERGLLDYENLLSQIENQADLLTTQHDLNREEIYILNTASEKQQALNDSISQSRARVMSLEHGARMGTLFADALAEAMPTNTGTIVGVASGIIADLFAGARAGAKMGQFAITDQFGKMSAEAQMAELDFSHTKEAVAAETNIKLRALQGGFAIDQQLLVLENMVRSEIVLRYELYVLAEAMQQSADRYLAILARGERLLQDRFRFRRQTAAQVQDYRYRDMSFRIFRNDALQKYRAQFDLAARYVYLAAKAYDYETTLLDYDSLAGQSFFTDIVKQRTIGMMQDGLPLTGSGLADPMRRMWQNFQVLKPQLGINNPQIETNRFSLRREMSRIRMDTGSNETWRNALESYRVDDLWDVPEFRRFCRPFAAEGIPQPGLVIPFTTTVTSGLNFFKWPLGGGDSYYSASNFATKIRSVGVWFSNYNSVGLAQTPRVYLVPVGEDILRTPYSGVQDIRTWQVVDQKLPLPFPIADTDLENNPGWIPVVDTIFDDMFQIRKHSDFRAYHDSGYLNSGEMQYDSSLIGRSVWNSRWLLIIPGQNLLYDAGEGIDTFINGPEVIGGTGERTGFGVSDIKIFFETYGYSGN
ncbi:MAG: right-handed parallel beta-helix repeat-containing protein [Desulfobulbaceae bacterium]|nr:right-handed parallel beta-helix repeat-containing protein [Desulfobulbaceae bacterium]